MVAPAVAVTHVDGVSSGTSAPVGPSDRALAGQADTPTTVSATGWGRPPGLGATGRSLIVTEP